MAANDELDIWGQAYFAVGRGVSRVTASHGGQSGFMALLRGRCPHCGQARGECTNQQDVLLAILSGAVSAARGVSTAHANLFPELIVRDLEDAIAVSEVFARAMTSRWIWGLRRQSPDVDYDAQWAAITKDVLTLFGTYSRERYRDAWLVNLQFRHSRECEESGLGSGFTWMVESEILLTQALAAARHEVEPSLEGLPLPFESSYAMSKAGWPSSPRVGDDDLQCSTEAHAALLIAEAAMNSAWHALREDRRR